MVTEAIFVFFTEIIFIQMKVIGENLTEFSDFVKTTNKINEN